MILAVFGALWLATWSVMSFGARWGVLALIVAGAVAIFSLGRRRYQQHRVALAAEADLPERKKASRVYKLVGIAEWALVLAVTYILVRMGHGRWALPAVMLIVGAHFFPLGVAFGSPLQHWTGAALTLWALGYPLFARHGPADPIGALGTGVILWSNAIASLALSVTLRRIARK